MPDEPAPTTVEGPALGERPPDDELALDVAQARVAEKLFGVKAAVTIGRYKLLELVGRGGMGVVWGAWDPELERKVAIKLVDPLRPAARDRVVGEARALAKLSHPNVVPIYDVGVVDDSVYLVMEWVAGDSLRTYLEARRSASDIVEVYTQAARGLAAVHAAGLIHRDFKPDNAMIGKDGRVRVLDFGLARGDITGGAADLAGTPRYMAPEQLDGAQLTPAVDQYALCVALREALEARGEVPRWLAAIIERGTAAAPADRFASMDELTRALERDPAKIRRLRILVAGALVATAAAFVIGREVDTETCTAPASALTAVARDRVAAHLDQLGGFAASERPALVTLFADHQHAWADAHHAACVAHDRHIITTTLYERRLTCLARADASLAAAAEILQFTTIEAFPDARIAASALVDPASCASVDQSLVPPPAPGSERLVRTAETALERARLLTTAARPDAVAAAKDAFAAAQATGYQPLIARALLVEGRALQLRQHASAPSVLEQAMRTGFAARDEATAVEAFARWAYLVAVNQDKVLDGTTVMEAVAGGLGPDARFARLLFLNNLAVVRIASGDRKAARAVLEAAMKDWSPGRGENDYELASIPQNLALAIDDPARSRELLATARTEVARTLGADHPKTIQIDSTLGELVDLPHARELEDGACASMARLFPQLRDDRAGYEYEAGWLAEEAGDRTAAAAHFTAVPYDAASEPLRATVAATLAALATDGADPAALGAALERAAADGANATSPWIKLGAADAYVAAARAYDTASDRVAAIRCWDAARALYEADSHPFVARRLAWARASLARALAASDPKAAAALAHAALTWYRQVGGYADAVAALTPLDLPAISPP